MNCSCCLTAARLIFNNRFTPFGGIFRQQISRSAERDRGAESRLSARSALLPSAEVFTGHPRSWTLQAFEKA